MLVFRGGVKNIFTSQKQTTHPSTHERVIPQPQKNIAKQIPIINGLGMGDLQPLMTGILISWVYFHPYGLGLMSLSPIIWKYREFRPWHKSLLFSLATHREYPGLCLPHTLHEGTVLESPQRQKTRILFGKLHF